MTHASPTCRRCHGTGFVRVVDLAPGVSSNENCLCRREDFEEDVAMPRIDLDLRDALARKLLALKRGGATYESERIMRALGRSFFKAGRRGRLARLSSDDIRTALAQHIMRATGLDTNECERIAAALVREAT